MPASEGVTRSLGRAILLLDTLASRRDMALSDLARATDLPKATVHRLLATLMLESLVVFDPVSEHYRLGPKIVRWAEHMVTGDELRLASRPIMERLSRETDETVGLVERIGSNSVCVMAVHSLHELRVAVRVGLPRALTVGAPSRALLAFIPELEARKVLASLKLTQPQATAVLQELRKVKSRGFARSIGESLPGVYSLAMPILDIVGRPRASLALYAPEARVSPAREKRWISQLKRASVDLGQQIASMSVSDVRRTTMVA